MSAGKGELAHLVEGQPSGIQRVRGIGVGVGLIRLARAEDCHRGLDLSGVDGQVETEPGNGMLKRSEELQWTRVDGKTFASGLEGVSELFWPFAIGEFPKETVDCERGPLADEPGFAKLEGESHKTAGNDGGARGGCGELIDGLAGKSSAILIEGATVAGRIARRADQSAKFHESLIQLGTRLA